MTAVPNLRRTLGETFRERSRQWIARLYRHELLMARTVRGLQVEAQDRFNRDIVRPMLQVVAGRLATFDLRGNDVVMELFPPLRQLEREIAAVAASGADAVRRHTSERFLDLTKQEAAWLADTAERTLRVDVPMMDPTASAAKAADKPILGKTTNEWFRDMLQEPVAKNVKAWVQTGIQRGLTTDEITRGLRGTKDTPGVLTQSRAAVSTMVRTASTHVLNQARIDNLQALGVQEVRFVATLDERTSLICASQDGKVYETGKGPVPPLHPNCRSVVVPWFGPTKGAIRATVDGPVPADMTFRSWLNTQSASKQDEILGRQRASAWRAGKLSFERMIGPDLKPLSIAELRRLDLIGGDDDV